MKYTLRLVAVAVCMSFVVGCAFAVYMAPASADAEAKTFRPRPGNASIYVNRRDTPHGMARGIAIVCDGHLIGGLAVGTYLVMTVPPGHHVVMAKGNMTTIAQTELYVEQGKNYFFDVNLSLMIVQSLNLVELRQLSDEEGQRDVAASSRAETDAMRY